MTDSIAAQVAALPKKPTPELKQMWRELFDKEPPGFSRNYLISRLAYRIQELAYGGLKPARWPTVSTRRQRGSVWSTVRSLARS
jgi:Protein of unknown function (DUF2924)